MEAPESMYVRATLRCNKDGSVVRYLQLAHNVWDPEKKRSRTEVLYNFGREDASSREALERLAGSLSRFLAATNAGRRIRTVAESRETALLMGIDISRLVPQLFVASALLAALAGILFAVNYQQVSAKVFPTDPSSTTSSQIRTMRPLFAPSLRWQTICRSAWSRRGWKLLSRSSS